MTPQRLSQIEELYHSAREREPDQRAAFLAGACKDDEELQREVESLLDANSSGACFLDEQVMRQAAGIFVSGQSQSEQRFALGLELGPYVMCPSCSADIPERSRFCLACGTALGSTSEVPTAAMPPPRTPVPSSSLDEGRFSAGTVLAERYRIIGLLGRGGMGEVYRANDLKLGQPVALKFVPKAAAKNQQLHARLHAEVRIARQVSHPNVCRVYDIGEVDGSKSFRWSTSMARTWAPFCGVSGACLATRAWTSHGGCARVWLPRMIRACYIAI